VSRDPSDNREHLPPWLRGVPLPPRPADAGPPDSAPAPSDAPEPLPAWLRDMGDEADAPTPSGETLPAWLRDTPEPAAPAEQPTSGEPLPDWLRDLGGETGDTGAGEPQAAQEPEAAAEPDVPPWLRDLASETPTPSEPAEEAVPDWLRASAETPTPSEPAEEAVPDWLRASAETPTPSEPAEEAVPDWLRASAETPTPSEPAEEAVPDWLRETAQPEPEPDALAEDVPDIKPFTLDDLEEGPGETSETPAPPQQEPAQDVPAWLAGIGDSAEDSAPAWLGAVQPDEPAPSAADLGDVPEWLRDIGSGAEERAPEETQAADQQAADADVPAWLREPAPAEEQEPAAPDIPAWLRDTDSGAGETQAADADVPAWLRESTPAEDQGPGAPDIPDWLRGADSGADETQAADADVPAWLREPAPAEEQEPAASDIPAWLRDAIPAEDQGLAAPAAAEPQNGEDLPDWLRDVDSSAAQPPEVAAPDDLPDWLRADIPAFTGQGEGQREPATAGPAEQGAGTADDTLPPWLRDESGEPLPTAAPPGEAGLPEWLRGASAEAPTASQDTSGGAAEPPDLSWLTEEEQAPADEETSGLLGGAELPDWLKAETEPEPETPTVDTRSVEWLTRLGVQEDEAVATRAPAAPLLAPPQAPMRTPAQIEAAALLQRLAAEPYPAEDQAPAPAKVPLWRRLGLERALYLLLLIALIAGLAMPELSASLAAPPSAAGASDIFERIDALTERDVVLVGYEWDARRISELRPLEDAVLGHLIEKRVKLVLVSTDPQGTLLLFDLRDKLTAAQYRQNGEGYLLLGFKPGGELALRTMAQDLTATLRSDFLGNDATVSALALGLDTGVPLNSLRDFAMTLVLADDAADVQAWMEQVRPVTDATADEPAQPMAFLLPAEAEPIVQPYMVQPDVFHLSGANGALAYQALRGDDAAGGDLIAAAGRQRFAALALAALLTLGALAGLISRIASRRSAP